MRQSILVVDEPVVATDIEGVFADLGYDVPERATSVAQALEHIWIEAVDAAVMDVCVGGEWTYDLADELASREVPFLFTTSLGPESLPPRFRDRPLIEKPIEVPELVVAVTRLTGLIEPGQPPAPFTSLWPLDPFSRAELERIEAHIAEGEARIARIDLVLALRPTPEGRRLLDELRTYLSTMTKHRDLLRRALAPRR